MGGKKDMAKDRKVTSKDVHRDAGQAVKTAAKYSRQTKEEFQKTLNTRLRELGAEIAEFGKKGRDLKDEAKADWDRKMGDLKTKRKAAGDKLAEVGHASEEAWKDIRKGAQSAWNDLDKAFRNASKKL